MSAMVESLKRLYSQGKVSIMKLDEMLSSGKISQEEYNYIIS